ncbi:nectin-4-like isoform X1 [Stegostoma tigrinum]|uniref:nectin-4-like isoform X1 n=1 Tax=Stegostoma tigrinum TaxID=3053191 RepID=UPI00286FB7F4|nr:nectin-4-like isoform X1 [Stegostoma tigrinum]
MPTCGISVAVVLWLLVWHLGAAAPGPINVNGDQILRSVGDDTLLPCTIDTEQTISQFMWRHRRGQQQRNFFTASFRNGKTETLDDTFDDRMTYVGTSSKNASMYLRNITLSDEGTYSCIFTLFPAGPVETDLQLIVTAPPAVTIQTYPVFSLIDCSRRLIVTCIAANAKPAAGITWEVPFNIRANQNTGHPAANGTVTVSSQFHLCPNKSLYGQNIVCVVEHPALRASKRVSYRLNIDYISSVLIKPQKNEDGYLYLICAADANPPPTEYIWTKLNDSIPEGVIIQHDRIKLPKLTPEPYGYYTCAASNIAGTASGSIYLFPLADDQKERHYMVPFIVIILMLIILLSTFGYFYQRLRRKNQQRSIGKETSSKMMPSRSSCDPRTQHSEVEEQVQVEEDEPDIHSEETV